MKPCLYAISSWWGAQVLRALNRETNDTGNVYAGDDLRERLWPYNWRYVFFLNWSEIVPNDIIERYECVNFHCTPLPYGRGGHPIENLMLDRQTETVITAHRMTSELDAGPIYGTRGPVSLAGSKADIQQRFIAPVADLIRWIVETEPTPTPQVGTPVVFHRLTPEAYQQFWSTRG